MPFSLRCIQCTVTSVLEDQQYIFGLTSLLVSRCWESVIDKKQAGRPVVTTDVMIAAVNTLIQSDQHVLIYGINVPMNFDNTLKNETNVWRLDKTNVWCLDRLACCLYWQHCTKCNAPVFNLLKRTILRFFARRGDTLHRLGWNLARFSMH